MAKRSSSSSPYLPEDLIIIDIQRRLPLSCLPRLCCVSKSWNSILSNPNFVYDSLFSDAPANTQLLITTADIERTTHVYSSLSYDSLLPSNNNNSDVVFRQLPDELLHGGRFTALKLASCGGGLICFDYFDENLMVCLFNPATSETKILPPILLPSHHQIWYPHNQIWYPHNFCIGLTVMETDQGGEEDDKYYRYKLVSVSQYHVHTFTATGLENLRLEKKVHVFSSDYESLGWRELLPLLDSSSSSIILPSNLVLVTEISQWKKKKCYWIATEDGARDDEFYIVSFDPNTDMFHVGETKLPFPDKTWVVDSPVYMVKEEALVVLNGANEVWVLLQLDVRESWCKLYTIPFSSNIMSRWKSIGLSKHGKVICVDMNGEKNLQLGDVRTNQISTLPFEVGDNFGNLCYAQFMTYVPSKMSLSSRRIIDN